MNAEFNLLDLNPAYPKNPKTFGEKVKKARMERGLFMREFAEMVGVAEATVLNWERRGMVPAKAVVSRVEKFLSNGNNGDREQLSVSAEVPKCNRKTMGAC